MMAAGYQQAHGPSSGPKRRKLRTDMRSWSWMRYRMRFRRRASRTKSGRMRRISSVELKKARGTSETARVSKPPSAFERARPDSEPSIFDGLPHLSRRLRAGEALPGSEGHRVVAVVDRRSGQPMVLKVLGLERNASWEAWDRFEHECITLRSVRHRGIARYVEHGRVETRAFLLMERARGRSLQEHLTRGERWTDLKLRHILVRTLEALAYLHELNPPVFHCDIHPEHVVVSERGDVALTSLGNARSLIPRSHDVAPLGREAYRRGAPSERPSPATDLYALGTTIAAVASGVDASSIPRRGSELDLDACMRPSVIRETVRIMLEPVAPAGSRSAAELGHWLQRLASR